MASVAVATLLVKKPKVNVGEDSLIPFASLLDRHQVGTMETAL